MTAKILGRYKRWKFDPFHSSSAPAFSHAHIFLILNNLGFLLRSYDYQMMSSMTKSSGYQWLLIILIIISVRQPP